MGYLGREGEFKHWEEVTTLSATFPYPPPSLSQTCPLPNSTGQPLNLPHHETCMHAHTHWSTRWWLMIGRLLTDFPLSFFLTEEVFRPLLTPPPPMPTLVQPGWDRCSVTQLSLFISVWLARYCFTCQYPLTMSNKEESSYPPQTHTHTRTDRHTRRRTVRVVGSTAWEQQSHFSPASEARKLWGMWVYSRTFRWAGTESFFTETWVGYFFVKTESPVFFFFFL